MFNPMAGMMGAGGGLANALMGRMGGGAPPAPPMQMGGQMGNRHPAGPPFQPNYIPGPPGAGLAGAMGQPPSPAPQQIAQGMWSKSSAPQQNSGAPGQPKAPTPTTMPGTTPALGAETSQIQGQMATGTAPPNLFNTLMSKMQGPQGPR